MQTWQRLYISTHYFKKLFPSLGRWTSFGQGPTGKACGPESGDSQCDGVCLSSHHQESRVGNPWGPLANQSSKMGALQVQSQAVSQKMRCKVIEDVNQMMST